ncbi:MAG: nucleotidyltransferase domain-containing protein [Candidatus Woesearchaeota archaeon]
MLTVLKVGYAKIMQLFYEDKLVKLHLREIARQTQLFEPSAYRFLNALEHDDVLQSQKDGNLKKYSIKRGTKVYFIFQAFDLEKLDKLPSIRKNAINIYLNTLCEKPIFAILFGSTAKQTYKQYSDIDILLITNNKIATKKAEQEVYALAGISISTFQITYSDFLTELKMKEDKVVQSALNYGYPLLNHIQFYEVLYNERI